MAYQRKMLDKGVWLEFDMIGLDITFPKEGIAPGVQETADAVAHLIELGYPPGSQGDRPDDPRQLQNGK